MRAAPPPRWLIRCGAWAAAALLSACSSSAQPAIAAAAEAEAAKRTADQWIVLATESSPLAAARRKSDVARQPTIQSAGATLQVMASSDCANLRPGLMLVVARAEALSLAQARSVVLDAYARPCLSQGPSLSHWGIDAVDPSLAQMRAEPINWSPNDALTRIVGTLDGGPTVLLRPYYADERDDPREGLRTAVDLLAANQSTAQRLLADCSFPTLSIDGRLLAVACATEQVADQLVYETQVLELAAKPLTLTVVPRCATPKLTASTRSLSCLKQSIGPTGQITTRRLETSF